MSRVQRSSAQRKGPGGGRMDDKDSDSDLDVFVGIGGFGESREEGVVEKGG